MFRGVRTFVTALEKCTLHKVAIHQLRSSKSVTELADYNLICTKRKTKTCPFVARHSSHTGVKFAVKRYEFLSD